MRLDLPVLRSFVPAKRFRRDDIPDPLRVNAFAFHYQGARAACSRDDEAIDLYDCLKGTRISLLHAKKYGAALLSYSRHDDVVLCASANAWDHSLRQLALSSNTYTRYYRGHRGRVTSLSVNPTNDALLSTSVDQTCRIWDARSSACQGLLRLAGVGASAFGPEGKVFCVGATQGNLLLFDARNHDRGPFAQAAPDPSAVWRGLSFSGDGRWILASAASGAVYVLDSFSMQLRVRFGPHRQSPTHADVAPLAASFSPDSRFVLCGAEDGNIVVYDVDTSQNTIWSGAHKGPVSALAFNPRYAMVASADSEVVFWATHDTD